MKIARNKYAAIIFATLITISIFGCSKDKDDKPSATSHKIVFKAEASSGSTLQLVVFGYDNTLTTASSLGGTTWTSPEITAPANATVASVVLNAIGANAASTLKVQVYVDGVLKKEGTGTGTALTATAQFNLK